MAPTIAEMARLDSTLSQIRPLRVLKVGPGNGTNLMLLKQAQPTAELHGNDISPKRMRVGLAC